MGASNLKGNVAELAVATECAKRDWVVGVVFGDDAPYDLLVDTGKQILKVQVKYISVKNGSLYVPFHSSTNKSYIDSCDVLAVYCPETDSIYWIETQSEVCQSVKTTLTLRISKPKNNQTQGIRLAEDFIMRA